MNNENIAMKIYKALKQNLEKRMTGIIRLNEPMEKHTTYRIGGPAKLLIWVWKLDDLKTVYKEIVKKKFKFIILGDGSNILVRDKGINGIVLKISRMKKTNDNIKIISESKRNVHLAITGWTKKSDLVSFAKKRGLSGAEFLWGIPGTIAAGVKMNAGNFLGKFSDIVNEIKVIDKNGLEKRIKKEKLKFGYRSLKFWGSERPISEVILILKKDKILNIEGKLDKLKKYRQKTQPAGCKSAGSVFINPKGRFAGKLIEEIGGKGLCVGDAVVSEKHANFIINKGNAKANDVLALIRSIRKRVREKMRVMLKEEIKIVGD